jgi:hypothetical protein
MLLNTCITFKTEVENKNGEYNDIGNNGHQTQN